MSDSDWLQPAIELAQAYPKEAPVIALGMVAARLGEIGVELKRSNDSRDQFYTEVLDLLVRITEDPMAGPKSETRCSAMRGPNSWDQCVNPAGHRDQRLHVDEAGIAFSEDLSESLRSGQPAATPDGQEGREGE